MVNAYDANPSPTVYLGLMAHRKNSRPHPFPTPPLAAFVEPKITMSEIAREAGVSVSYISRICSGETPASRKVREAAARLLGLPEHVLFGVELEEAS